MKTICAITFMQAFAFCGFVNCSQKKNHATLVVSFDGLRASSLNEFLKDYPDSALNKFLKSGVKADYMTPAFPSATFPNHFTLVTGWFVSWYP